MYSIQVLTPPDAECVTASDLKAFLRLNTSDEDSLLAGFISAARQTFEEATNRIVLPTEFRQWFYKLDGPVYLMRGQVTDIEQTQYYDQNDTLQNLAVNKDTSGIPASVWAANNQYPPVSADLRPVGYVDFIAGWNDAQSVPALVKEGIKLLAAHFWKNRSAFLDKKPMEMPQGFAAICNLYRTGLQGTWDHNRQEYLSRFYTYPLGWGWLP